MRVKEEERGVERVNKRSKCVGRVTGRNWGWSDIFIKEVEINFV